MKTAISWKNINKGNVASIFASLVRIYVGPEKMRQIINRNLEEKSNGVCHSHDFCDANVFMAEAICRATGAKQDEVCAKIGKGIGLKIWNDAWNLAKKHEFYEKREPGSAKLKAIFEWILKNTNLSNPGQEYAEEHADYEKIEKHFGGELIQTGGGIEVVLILACPGNAIAVGDTSLSLYVGDPGKKAYDIFWDECDARETLSYLA